MKSLQKSALTLALLNIGYFLSLFSMGVFIFRQVFISQAVSPVEYTASVVCLGVAFLILTLKDKVLENRVR